MKKLKNITQIACALFCIKFPIGQAVLALIGLPAPGLPAPTQTHWPRGSDFPVAGLQRSESLQHPVPALT